MNEAWKLRLRTALTGWLVVTFVLAGATGWARTGLVGPPPAGPGAAVPMPEMAAEIPDWQARWELARLLSYAKRYDEALLEYDRVIKERPDAAGLRMEKVRVLFWAGRAEQALRLFEQLPKEQLGDADRVAMADIYVGLKEYDKAKAIYCEHLGRFPAEHGVRLKLAELLGWMKQYDAAIHEYRLILKALPNDSQVRRKYAFVLTWAGQREEAIRELQQSLAPVGKSGP